MRPAVQHEVAVDLVAHHHGARLAAKGGHAGQGGGVPLQSYGVVGIAQYHHPGPLAPQQVGQPVKVHAVLLAVENEGILQHAAVVALNHHPEGVIHRRLDHHCIPPARKVVYAQRYALHHPRNECQLAALHLEAVAARLPVDDALPVGLRRGGVAQHGVLQPLPQGINDIGAHGEVQVGNP